MALERKEVEDEEEEEETLTDYPDFEALKAQQIRDALVRGRHTPCPECAAGRPAGGVLPDHWALVITSSRAGMTYTSHTAHCSLAP